MCTSGAMYDIDWEIKQVESKTTQEITDQPEDRVCAYSGLLNVSEYQTITENEERIANEIRPEDSM